MSDYRAKGPSRHLSRKEKESDLDPRIRSSEMKIELNKLLRGTLETGSASPMLVGLGALLGLNGTWVAFERVEQSPERVKTRLNGG